MSTARRLTPITDDARFLAHWAGLGLLAAVAAASLLLAERRLAGALTTPLPAIALVMIAAVLVAWSRSVRALSQDYFAYATPWARKWLPKIAALSAPVIASASLSLPGTSWGGLALLWGILIAEEFLRPAVNRRPPRHMPVSIPHREVAPPAIETISEQESDSSDGPPDDEAIVEQMVRRREADGAESIAGWLRVAFIPDQQTAITHLAFCPPLEKTPRFAAEPVDGSNATIKPTHLYTHGARLEVKLDRPAIAATSVLVEFSAWTEEVTSS